MPETLLEAYDNMTNPEKTKHIDPTTSVEMQEGEVKEFTKEKEKKTTRENRIQTMIIHTSNKRACNQKMPWRR